MASPTMLDASSRTGPMAEKKRWVPKRDFKPGGEKGKLHRELGVSTSEKIPESKLAAAENSSNPEIKRDAIRAKTMKGWHHGGSLYKGKD